jgi:hypothetical protein
MGFEHMTSVLEREKTIHALYQADTVIGRKYGSTKLSSTSDRDMCSVT